MSPHTPTGPPALEPRASIAARDYLEPVRQRLLIAMPQTPAGVRVNDIHIPPPTNTKEVQRVITQVLVESLALDPFNRDREFRQEQAYAGYLTAGGNYQAALWRWVWRVTPDVLAERLNAARFALPQTQNSKGHICLVHHDYMLKRAIFLYGLKTGEGLNARHWRYFAQWADYARGLGDDALFEETARVRRWKTPKGQPSDRKLKYLLLLTWLAGGLWCMKSRDDQAAALYTWWPDAPPYGPDALHHAQIRLGLRWFNARSVGHQPRRSTLAKPTGIPASAG